MIALDRRTLARIGEHAAAAYPRECCGALLGRANGGERAVLDIVPIDNRRTGEAARRRFLVTPDDYRRVESGARERGLDIVGFYHSHPDHPAVPSEYDREHALPWYSYVIVSVINAVAEETASWKLALDRSRFEREAVAVKEGD